MGYRKMAICLLCVVLLTGCMAEGPTHNSAQTVSVPDSIKPATQAMSSVESGPSAPQPMSRARALLEEMTLEEMVAQLFIVPMTGQDAMEAFLQQYPVGGVIYFAANIQNPAQITASTRGLQEAARIPIFIAVDEEGGRVARIANNKNFDVPKFESMEAVGNTNDPDNAFFAGATIGNYLLQYGFNLDFAPVADVNTNPDNIVIGDRAFGSDPEPVARMVSAAIDGFHSQGIMTCVKHFPGHGDTTGDTHYNQVAVYKTWNQLLACELVPFRESMHKTDFVMMAHVMAPVVTDDGLPCSLSYQMITGKLRQELGYEGLVITDSLSMSAITKEYSSSQAAVLAFQAGADVLLMPKDFEDAYEGLLQAVRDGRITRQRLEESVLRILEKKDSYGLLQ